MIGEKSARKQSVSMTRSADETTIELTFPGATRSYTMNCIIRYLFHLR
jgi:hypothetical protein